MKYRVPSISISAKTFVVQEQRVLGLKYGAEIMKMKLNVYLFTRHSFLVYLKNNSFCFTTSQDCIPALESVNEMTISSAEASIQVDDEVDGVYCIFPPFCSPCLYMQLFFFSLANVIVSPEPPHVTTCRKRPPLQYINIIPVMHWNLS